MLDVLLLANPVLSLLLQLSLKLLIMSNVLVSQLGLLNLLTQSDDFLMQMLISVVFFCLGSLLDRRFPANPVQFNLVLINKWFFPLDVHSLTQLLSFLSHTLCFRFLFHQHRLNLGYFCHLRVHQLLCIYLLSCLLHFLLMTKLWLQIGLYLIYLLLLSSWFS